MTEKKDFVIVSKNGRDSKLGLHLESEPMTYQKAINLLKKMTNDFKEKYDESPYF